MAVAVQRMPAFPVAVKGQTGTLLMVLHCLQVIGFVAEFKYGVTRWLLLHTNLFVAWLFNTVVSLLLVAGSSVLVVGYAPAAVSSGVPEVMAYLNGELTLLGRGVCRGVWASPPLFPVLRGCHLSNQQSETCWCMFIDLPCDWQGFRSCS